MFFLPLAGDLKKYTDKDDENPVHYKSDPPPPLTHPPPPVWDVSNEGRVRRGAPKSQ